MRADCVHTLVGVACAPDALLVLLARFSMPASPFPRVPLAANGPALLAAADSPLSRLPAAMAVAEERGETTPLQPAHIHEAYQRLIEQDKVPGKTARRRAFL